MKALKFLGVVLLASSVGCYLVGILSGEFFINVSGLLYYGTSMKAFWLTTISIVCLLFALIVMLIVLCPSKYKKITK